MNSGPPKKNLYFLGFLWGLVIIIKLCQKKKKKSHRLIFVFVLILKKYVDDDSQPFLKEIARAGCGQYTECGIFARPHLAGTRSASTHFCSHTNCAKIRKSAEKLSTNVCVKLDTSMLLLLICQENRRNKSCYMVW